MTEKLDQLTEEIKSRDLDGLLVFKRENLENKNLLYLSGFTGSTAYGIITPKARILITDDRYLEQAEEESPEFEIMEYERPYIEKLREAIQGLEVEKLGFETKGLTVDALNELEEKIPEVDLVPTTDVVAELRSRKTPEEVELLREAANITDESFDYILDLIEPGMSERELALKLEFFIRDNKNSELAFETIFVTGARTSLQHGRPSDEKIREGDFVLIDFGAKYNHYCSDMTRTLVVGNPSEKQKDIYRVVKKAQEKALRSLQPDVTALQVSEEAWSVVEEAGYDEHVGRGVGHGVGLAVHEKPYVRDEEDIVLEPGHVVTVEPGIYIAGWGGVRIEDTAVITEDGYKRLTNTEKELLRL